jgi:hypothetical protein
MSNEVLVAIVSGMTTLSIAVAGWVFAYNLQYSSARFQRLQKRVSRLETEVRARIGHERTACDWIGQLLDKSPESVKRDLRARTHARTGTRPRMAESDLSPSKELPS